MIGIVSFAGVLIEEVFGVAWLPKGVSLLGGSEVASPVLVLEAGFGSIFIVSSWGV